MPNMAPASTVMIDPMEQGTLGGGALHLPVRHLYGPRHVRRRGADKLGSLVARSLE